MIISKDIKYIVSHEQALKQTQNNRKKLLNNIIEIEEADATLSTKKLSEDEYNENSAVICSKISFIWN